MVVFNGSREKAGTKMHHLEMPMHGLVDFVKDQIVKNAAFFGARRNHWVSEIYYADLFLDDPDKIACNLKFRIRGQDACTPNRGRSIALDGIEVFPTFQRRGIATGILRDLACSLVEEPWHISGVVLNPVSDEMEALLDKMGIEFRSRGVACICRHHF